MEKVSVVVATFRREHELKRALDSLAAQTYQNMEIVLVDDNWNAEWNAKVTTIVEAFVHHNPAVSLNLITNGVNQGSAKARNIGIAEAKGEFVTFLDDDDVYLPDKIKKQAAFMVQGNYDFSITDLFLYNKNDRLVDKRIRSYLCGVEQQDLAKYHMMYHLTGTDTLMFRRTFLNSIGGFGPSDVGDEYYLMQRAIEAGGKFGYLPECDVKAYIHTGEGGVSSGDGKLAGENLINCRGYRLFFKRYLLFLSL